MHRFHRVEMKTYRASQQLLLQYCVCVAILYTYNIKFLCIASYNSNRHYMHQTNSLAMQICKDS